MLSCAAQRPGGARSTPAMRMLQTAFINAVFEKANSFYERLEKTKEGRVILERLRKAR